MAEGGAEAERFVVQQAKGKKWETLTVHETPVAGAAAFSSAVQAAPRSFLRLIRLQADPSARGEVYDWTLVSLHDPRRHAAPPTAAPTARPARRRGRAVGPERIKVPIRLYILLFLSGAMLVLLWLLAGGLAR
jgi:hypothetical protein